MQILKHNQFLFAQCKSWLCCAKNAISRALEISKIKHFPGAVPLEPHGGLTVYPQALGDFLDCSNSLEKRRLTKAL